jgi:hypothetical protein
MQGLNLQQPALGAAEFRKWWNEGDGWLKHQDADDIYRKAVECYTLAPLPAKPALGDGAERRVERQQEQRRGRWPFYQRLEEHSGEEG